MPLIAVNKIILNDFYLIFFSTVLSHKNVTGAIVN